MAGVVVIRFCRHLQIRAGRRITVMRRFIGPGLGLITVAFLVTGVSAQSLSIVPGQSIGSFRIGQDLPGVLDALGPLHSRDEFPGRPFTGYYWPLKRIAVIVNKTTQKVAALGVQLDDTYRTDKGVGAGTEMDAVRSAYGTEDGVDSHEDDDTLVYDKLGVAFVVDKSGALGSRVSFILIFGAGHYQDIFKAQ